MRYFQYYKTKTMACRFNFIRIIVGLVFVFLCPTFAPSQGTSNNSQDLELICRNFVQKFYDWYIPKALKEVDSNIPASDLALKEKGSAFSSELTRALKEDSEAQKKATGEIVGIDFDPFLFAQDPCDRYVVERISRREESYWADIYGICSGKKHNKPDVVAELKFKDAQWVFVNFHYGNGKPEDLLSILKRLRESRQKKSQ